MNKILENNSAIVSMMATKDTLVYPACSFKNRAGKMAQKLKCLIFKHKELSSDLPCRLRESQHNSVTQAWVGQRQVDP